MSHDVIVFTAGIVTGIFLTLVATRVGAQLVIGRRHPNPQPAAQRYTPSGRPLPGPGRDRHP